MTPILVKRFLVTLKQHKLLNLLLFTLIISASVVLAVRAKSEQPEVTYQSVGKLSVRTSLPVSTTTAEQLPQRNTLINRDLLLSNQVLEGVKDSLNIDNSQLAAIVKQLEIILPQETSTVAKNPQQEEIIILEYNGKINSTESRETLGVFMEEMVDYSRELNTYQLQQRINTLTEKVTTVQKDLKEAEEAYYRYSSNEGSALLGVEDGSLLTGITNAQTQQRQVKLSLEEINAKIQSIVTQLGLTPEQAYRSSILSGDPMIATLRAQILEIEAGREQLQKELRDEHPKMIELSRRQEESEQSLLQRAGELIGQDKIATASPEDIRKESNLDIVRQELANQLVTLQTEKEGLTSQLKALEEMEEELLKKYQDSPDKQVEQAKLLQEVESQRSLYQSVRTSLTDTKAAEAEIGSNLVIAQAPYIPQSIARRGLLTNPLLILGGGFILGLLTVGGVTIILASLDDRLHTDQELRATLASFGLPVLGKIPHITSRQKGKLGNWVLKNTDSPYLAFYERVRSNIIRFGTESSRLILVTSINREEGKSVTAYNLAIASAQAGKRTLLLEADLRSSSLAGVFDLEIPPHAKVEPLRYYGSRSDCIHLVPKQENLYFLGSPGPQKQAVRIIESNEVQRILRDARGRFDLVIIDTPSLVSYNDALLLESLIDGIILVTRPGITQKSTLNQTIEQFAARKLPLLGAVINDIKSNSTSDFDYPSEKIIFVNMK